MGHRLNRLDEPDFMAVSKPVLTEFGIHHRLESCEGGYKICIRYKIVGCINLLFPTENLIQAFEEGELYVRVFFNILFREKNRSNKKANVSQQQRVVL